MTENPNAGQALPEKPATEPLKFLADRGLGLFGLLAAIAYAISRPLYDAFYAPLALRPEDLGLSQVEMISRGTSFVVIIGLFFAVPIMLGIVLYYSLLGRRFILQVTVLAGLALVGWLLLLRGSGVTVSRTVGFFVAFAPYIAAVPLFIFDRPSPRKSYRDMLFPSAPKLVPWLLVCSGLGVAIFYLGLFGWTASSDAGERFLNTGHVDQPWSDFLNIRSDRVLITPLGQDKLKICDGQRDGYLLGRPNGAVFVLLVPRNTDSAEPPAVVRLGNEDYNTVALKDAPACKVSSETKQN